ncbi:MAG: hypothetical protein JOZ72_16960 [Alphaproteobacteria bacterium]|nr:hypothetical protein [Alphaproteobacteria bacterium]
MRAILTALLLLAAPAAADPVADIARQLDTHSVIQLGEYHRSLQIHGFIQQLLHDPRFVCRVDDVVVEFGNSRLQGLADAYASGGMLTEAQIAGMWRETSVPLTWNTPVYRAVYDAVREINRTHLCKHPLRLALADAPLDWSKIAGPKDLEPFADRDTAMADTVEREVLAKHRHAFLITGEFHAEKKTSDEADGLRTAQIIERRHPGSLFVVVTVPAAQAAATLHMGPAPSFLMAPKDAPFAMTKEGWTPAAPATGFAIAEVADGILYVGGNSSLFPSPEIYLDEAYAKELRRRAAIVKDMTGQDFVAVVDDLIKEGRDQKALANPEPPPPH